MYSYAGDIAATHPYRYQPTPKLTPQQADELPRRVAAGEVRREVARDYGISINTLYRYLRAGA